MKSLFFKPSFYLIVLSAFLQLQCLDSDIDNANDPYKQLQKDIVTIDQYLTQNGKDAIKDPSGVRIAIVALGQGLPASSFNTVKVDYKGRVLNSTETFEEGVTSLKVSDYIAGWQIALTTLPVGTKAALYIPSPLAYGEASQEKIPANSILVFDVDIQEIILSNDEVTRFKNDTTAINNYVTSKSIQNVVKLPSGVRMVQTVVGAGPKPTVFDSLELKMSIKSLTDDTKVLATLEREPTGVWLSRVVDYLNGGLSGMKAGLLEMNEGSKAVLYIPSGLAFGPNTMYNNGAPIIQPNTNIIVEVELINVLP